MHKDDEIRGLGKEGNLQGEAEQPSILSSYVVNSHAIMKKLDND